MIPIYFTQYLGPILTLLAAMFTATQLNKGSELIPLRAAGLPISRILASFFMIALVMALSMILVQELVVPSFKDQIRLADSYGRALASIQPDMVADSRNNLIRVTNYLPHEKRGQDVEITTKHSGLSITSKITRAREILWKNPQGGEPYWLLRDGEVEQFDEMGMKIGTEILRDETHHRYAAGRSRIERQRNRISFLQGTTRSVQTATLSQASRGQTPSTLRLPAGELHPADAGVALHP